MVDIALGFEELARRLGQLDNGWRGRRTVSRQRQGKPQRYSGY
jgi:hypothetical protein